MRLALRLLLLALLVVLVVAGRWLWVASSVGAGYAAKVVCSLAFVSGQDPDDVMQRYVRYEVAPLGPALRVDASRADVNAYVLGVPWARAVARPGLGCTLIPSGVASGIELRRGLEEPRPSPDPQRAWPRGAAGPARPPPAPVAEAIARAFEEPGGGTRRQTTAVVVAHDGRLVAEAYAPGYGPTVPMLSWSMAKSVTAALVGIAADEGRLDLYAPAPVPEWRGVGDPRGAITLDELLRMSSGLAFDETYGATNDVSVMLFTRGDTGAFAARSELAAPPDTVWSYSSGTTNIVSRTLRDAFGGDLGAMVRWTRSRLFDAADMTSALLEPDASGTFIGSSFAFMTARDWARFGELHRRGGEWYGRQVLPEGWVDYVTTPTPAAPDGTYGAHWWLNAGDPDHPERRMWPTVPRDTYAARGHSGQVVAVIPSARLVVVRLGLTVPDNSDDGVERLLADLAAYYAPKAR